MFAFSYVCRPRSTQHSHVPHPTFTPSALRKLKWNCTEGLIGASLALQPNRNHGDRSVNPMCKGVSHGQPRQAGPRGEEAEKRQRQARPWKISVPTRSGEAYDADYSADARDRTTKLKREELKPFVKLSCSSEPRSSLTPKSQKASGLVQHPAFPRPVAPVL
jgi:hypothetical protein